MARAAELVRPVAIGSLSTPHARSRERHRRIALSAVASLVARSVALIASLLGVPLALSSLGPERYGAWVALSSLVLMLAFMDLGIGSALLNLVSEADGRGDRPAILRYISSAACASVLVAAVLLVAFALVYPLIDWAALFRVSSDVGSREVGPALAVTFALFALGIPLGLAQRAQMAHQEGFAVSLWQAFGSLAGLVGLIVAVRLGAGMVAIALALAGGLALGALGNSVHFFRRRSWLRPDVSAVSGAAVRLVIRRGLLFVVLGVAASLAFVSDTLVADLVLGPDAAARYSVAQRLYFVAPALITLAVVPLWPAYSEALARGDRYWVRTTFSRSVAGSVLVAAAVAVALTALRVPIFSLWVGPELVPPLSLAVGLAVWSVLYAWGSAVVVLLNAANVIGLQVVFALSMAVAGLFLKTWLASVWGINGIVWGMIAAYVALTFVPYLAYFAWRSPLTRGAPEAMAAQT